MANGTIIQEIIKTEDINSTSSELYPSELEMPSLPQEPKAEHNSPLKSIHQTALNILKLQEIAKTQGRLSQEDEVKYRENLDALNLSAEQLTQIGDEEYDDILNINDSTGLSPWFERKRNIKKDKDKKKEEEKRKKEEAKRRKEEEKKEEEEEEEDIDNKRKEEDKKKKEEAKRKKEQEKKKKEEEEKIKQEKEKEEEESPEKEKEKEQESDTDEEVIIDLPPDDASVAEAKPVGLAIAGAGGVAASKPIATAVVGPGGLAIARPIGTAIAGVSPDQALVPIYAESEEMPSKKDTEKEKYKGKKKKITTSEYLNRIISKYHQV